MAEQIALASASEIARNNMVDCQVRPNHVSDTRVTGAMRALPREAFAPPGAQAYGDADIALGGGRYLLNPVLTARLVQLALAESPAHVLVIGAGAGYLAALLGAAGAQIVALEEDSRLDTGALKRFGVNVEAVSGKLAAGWPAGGPYDLILIEGAVLEIPEILAAQLTDKGRIIAILADDDQAGGIGRVVVAEPAGEGFSTVRIFDCTARLLPQFRPAPVFSF